MKEINYKLVFFVLWLLLPNNVLSQQLGNWTTLNYLNMGRFANIGVLANDSIIFTLCGFGYNMTPYPVEKAVINPDGTLSEWSIDTQSMNIARSSPVGFFYNGNIYVLGGSNPVSYIGQCTTVEKAKVNTDGTLGKWEYISPLLQGVKQASLVLTPPYVYIIGGWYDSNESSSAIVRGKIQPDGNIIEWAISTSQLLIGRRGLSTILIDSTIYVIGGTSLGHENESNNTECATLHPDGELSAFQFCGLTKVYHFQPALLFDGKHLNVIGGYVGGGNYEYRGERMLINSDGTLGEPEIAPGLQYETSGFGYVQAPTGGYVIGDADDYGFVQFAPFLAPTGIDKKYWEVLE